MQTETYAAIPAFRVTRAIASEALAAGMFEEDRVGMAEAFPADDVCFYEFMVGGLWIYGGHIFREVADHDTMTEFAEGASDCLPVLGDVLYAQLATGALYA
jgi:hypothetical protein